MSYTIQLTNFEGPLDLLLHLIKKEEVDIYDIPIAKITEQYLSYIKEAQELDLEVVSEFFIMAATLLSIKSRMLLPRDTEDEYGDEGDPRKELVQHLEAYQKFKAAAELLKEKANTGTFILRPVDVEFLDNHFKSSEDYLGKDLKDLCAAFKEVMKTNLTDIKEINFEKKLTISEQCEYIRGVLKKKPQGVFFNDLLEESNNIKILIITFMSLLEMSCRQEIIIKQHLSFGKIVIYLKKQKEATGE